MKQLSSVVKKWAAEWRKTHSVTAIISPNFPPGGTCLITGQEGKLKQSVKVTLRGGRGQ